MADTTGTAVLTFSPPTPVLVTPATPVNLFALPAGTFPAGQLASLSFVFQSSANDAIPATPRDVITATLTGPLGTSPLRYPGPVTLSTSPNGTLTLSFSPPNPETGGRKSSPSGGGFCTPQGASLCQLSQS